MSPAPLIAKVAPAGANARPSVPLAAPLAMVPASVSVWPATRHSRTAPSVASVASSVPPGAKATAETAPPAGCALASGRGWAGSLTS